MTPNRSHKNLFRCICILTLFFHGHISRGGEIHSVQRAQHSFAAFNEHVRIDRGRAHILAAEQILNGPDVLAVFQRVSGKTLNVWSVPCLILPALRTASATAFCNMLSEAWCPRISMGRGSSDLLWGGEYILPSPLSSGVGLFRTRACGMDTLPNPLKPKARNPAEWEKRASTSGLISRAGSARRRPG